MAAHVHQHGETHPNRERWHCHGARDRHPDDEHKKESAEKFGQEFLHDGLPDGMGHEIRDTRYEI
jgi:hypothetical protein